MSSIVKEFQILTDGSGAFTQTQELHTPMRFVGARLTKGGLAATVDLTLVATRPGVESEIGGSAGDGDTTLLTVTNASASASYDASADNIVEQFFKLTVAQGGAAAKGSLLCYFDPDLASKASIGSIAAGDNNIGNMDVVTLPDTRESWRVSTQSFTTADLSTKTFTVPATTEWQILSLYITLASTATAGNRVMVVQALDTNGTTILREYVFPVTQAASLTYRYQLGSDMPNDAALVDTTLLRATFATLLLTAGQKIKVFDRAVIAAAADDMTIQMQIASRSIA